MKLTLNRFALAVASAGILALYGCGGGGGSPVAADTTSMTVTPSLGRFSTGTVVELRKLDRTLISTGTVAANGSAVLALAGYTGPVVVKVLGGPLVTYYDEGTNSFQPFGASLELNAVMDAPRAQAGVTALTHAAHAMLGVNASTSIDAIKLANKQVASVWPDLALDILQAPTAVGAQVNNLKAGDLGDKYALFLAALAKTANAGKNAADVAKDLAEDLTDATYDGKNSRSATPAAILPSYTFGTLAARYYDAAQVFAESSAAATITLTSLVVRTTSVATVTVEPNQSAIDQAKTLFAELRTTLNSFANNNKTGFLDIQAKAMSDDLNANVASDMGRLQKRIQQMGMATSAFEDAVAYTSSATKGFVINFTSSGLSRTNGSLSDVWFGRNNFESCYTNSITPSLITQVQCFEAAADGADYANSRIKAMVYVITKTGANQYIYTATRYNMGVTTTPYLSFSSTDVKVVTDADSNPVPAGGGTISTTFSGSTRTAMTINGTLPPSATGTSRNGFPNAVVTTGADTIDITATRSALTGNNYRYALTGSTVASKLLPTVGTGVDPNKTTTVSFDSGSYFDVDETNVSTTGIKMIGTKVIGTVKTLATQFTGTLDLTAWSNDVDGLGFAPTNVNFNGKVSDITPSTGVGQILTGNLQVIANNYGQYHSTAVYSSTNFLKGTNTFTGTIQMPQRPLMSMTLGLVKSNYLGNTMTLNYTYSTTSITGSGSKDGVNSANDTMTLSNQDGIQLVTSTGKVTKAGVDLATIVGSQISYKDGVTQSLN